MAIECVICLDLPNDSVYVTTACGHIFHMKCLEASLKSAHGMVNSCPSCSQKLVLMNGTPFIKVYPNIPPSSEAEADRDSLVGNVQDLKKQLAQAQSEVLKAAAALGEVAGYKATVENLNAQIARAYKDATATRQAMNQLQGRYDNAQQTLQAAQNELAGCHERLTALRQEVDNTRADGQLWMVEKASMSEEYERCRLELEILRKELALFDKPGPPDLGSAMPRTASSGECAGFQDSETQTEPGVMPCPFRSNSSAEAGKFSGSSSSEGRSRCLCDPQNVETFFKMLNLVGDVQKFVTLKHDMMWRHVVQLKTLRRYPWLGEVLQFIDRICYLTTQEWTSPVRLLMREILDVYNLNSVSSVISDASVSNAAPKTVSSGNSDEKRANAKPRNTASVEDIFDAPSEKATETSCSKAGNVGECSKRPVRSISVPPAISSPPSTSGAPPALPDAGAPKLGVRASAKVVLQPFVRLKDTVDEIDAPSQQNRKRRAPTPCPRPGMMPTQLIDISDISSESSSDGHDVTFVERCKKACMQL